MQTVWTMLIFRQAINLRVIDEKTFGSLLATYSNIVSPPTSYYYILLVMKKNLAIINIKYNLKADGNSIPSLSTRTNKALIVELEYLAQLNHIDYATKVCKLLLDSILKAELAEAVRFLYEGHSLGYTTEQTHITLWDLIKYLQRTGHTFLLDPELVRHNYLNKMMVYIH